MKLRRFRSSVVSPKFATKFAVIPAKLAVPPEADQPQVKRARVGIQEIKGTLDYRFRGNDERKTPTYSVNF